MEPVRDRRMIASLATRIFSETGFDAAESVQSAEEIWDRCWDQYEEPAAPTEISKSQANRFGLYAFIVVVATGISAVVLNWLLPHLGVH